MSSNRLRALQSLARELQADFVNCWMPIAQTTLTGSVASVTFSSIPGNFRTLCVMTQIRTDRSSSTADAADVRFNSDSGSNYDSIIWQFRGDATTGTVTARATTQIDNIFQAASSTSRSDNFSTSISFLPGYARSDSEKQIISMNVRFGDTSADSELIVSLRSGRWRDTSSITSILILPSVGPNFVSGSKFALYGIL